MGEYLEKAFGNVQPMKAFTLSVIMYVMFPEPAYLTAFCAVLGVMVLDLLTKYRAIAANHGGYWKALKKGKLNSHSMWVGTSRKIIDYLIIFIMVGLSYRVSPVAGVVVFLGTFVYAIMFLRECQSIVENLNEAGGNWGWLLRVIKKRKKKIFDEEGVNENDEY